MPKWYEGCLSGCDLETTGVDPLTARIVTAALWTVRGHPEPAGRGRSWLVSVTEEIPAAAVAVHGVTTERARAEGRPLDQVLLEVVAELRQAWQTGPAVIFNASYDLTVMSAELDRVGLPRLEVGPVVDPLVIDRHVDKWRKGSRKLGDMAAHYGVKLANAHDAHADTLAAMRVAWQLGRRFPEVGDLSAADLHARQVVWAREQREDLQRYLRRRDPNALVDVGWPLASALTSSRS